MSADENRTTQPVNAEAAPAEGEVRWLPPERLGFSLSPHGHLRMTLDGRCSFRSVRLAPCFPVSSPDSFVAVRNALDEGAPEIGVIAEMATLPPEARRAAQAHMNGSCLLPAIREVAGLRQEFGYLYWRTVTDRGAREFATRDSQDGLQRLPDGGAVITDTDECRYRLPEPSRLDRASRALLTRHVTG